MNGAGFDAIVLKASDDVATALRAIRAGEVVRVRCGDGELALTATEDVALCHKLAITALAPGDAIRKYGEVIGEATAPIAAGAHVHVHNLRSRRGRR